jgi:hypothetical protein
MKSPSTDLTKEAERLMTYVVSPLIELFNVSVVVSVGSELGSEAEASNGGKREAKVITKRWEGKRNMLEAQVQSNKYAES